MKQGIKKATTFIFQLKKVASKMVGSIHWRQTSAQGTAEYALVILGAATLATLFIAWLNDTNRIGNLFDQIFRSIAKLI